MKKAFLFLLVLAAIKLNAQTADDIIQKYSNAMGGLDNFKKVKTAKLTGNAVAQGNSFALTVQIVNGKAMRTDVDVMGQSIVNCYKDDKGWKINPYDGAATATDVSGEELNEFKDESFLANALMDYKARNYSAELQGQEDVDGVKAYKIKLTKDNNKTDTYYIDPTTYMVIKFVGSRNVMGQDMELETYFSDIKDVGNLKFSMSRKVNAGGQTIQEVHLDKIELDVPVDDKIFNKG
ncbi:MAG TPA: hypothetical protein VGI82_05265 [Chitinophagaceae bacterium]